MRDIVDIDDFARFCRYAYLISIRLPTEAHADFDEVRPYFWVISFRLICL